MASSRCVRQSTREKTAESSTTYNLANPETVNISESEMQRLEMITNPWSFEFVTKYVCNDDNVWEQMATMYDNIKHEKEKALKKDLYKGMQMAMLRNNSQQYVLRSLPKDSDFLLKAKIDEKGFGVKAGKDIKADEMILTYMGEISLHANYDDSSNYVMYMGEEPGDSKGESKFKFKVDSLQHGNLFRFVNHACNNYNCEVIEGWFEEKLYNVLVACKNIPKDDELTYNYGMEIEYHNAFKDCFCEGTAPEVKHQFGERNSKRYRCQEWNHPLNPCRERFNTRFAKYKHHFFVHHVQGNLQCDECDHKPFKSFQGYLDHRQKLHGLRGLPLPSESE